MPLFTYISVRFQCISFTGKHTCTHDYELLVPTRGHKIKLVCVTRCCRRPSSLLGQMKVNKRSSKKGYAPLCVMIGHWTRLDRMVIINVYRSSSYYIATVQENMACLYVI